MKSSKVSIKTRSTPASLSFKGQATKHTTVKWSRSIFSNEVQASSSRCHKVSYAIHLHVSSRTSITTAWVGLWLGFFLSMKNSLRVRLLL